MRSLSVILLATPLLAAARNDSCKYWQPRGENGAEGWREEDIAYRVSPWIDCENVPENERCEPPKYEMGITVKPTIHIEEGRLEINDMYTQLLRIRDSLANQWNTTSVYQTDFNDTIVISYKHQERPYHTMGSSTSHWYAWSVYKRCWKGALRDCHDLPNNTLDGEFLAENITVCGYAVDEWNHDVEERTTYSPADPDPGLLMSSDGYEGDDFYTLMEPQEHYEDAVKHATWYRLAVARGEVDPDEDNDDDDEDSDAAGRQVASLGLSLGLVFLWMLMM